MALLAQVLIAFLLLATTLAEDTKQNSDKETKKAEAVKKDPYDFFNDDEFFSESNDNFSKKGKKDGEGKEENDDDDIFGHDFYGVPSNKKTMYGPYSHLTDQYKPEIPDMPKFKPRPSTTTRAPPPPPPPSPPPPPPQPRQQESKKVVQQQGPSRPYAFAYGVKDVDHGTNFNRAESSDGKGTTGQYNVHLPDGRVQTVNYKADKNGFQADILYDGQARISSQKPKSQQAPPVAPSHPPPPPPPPTHYSGSDDSGTNEPARGNNHHSTGYDRNDDRKPDDTQETYQRAKPEEREHRENPSSTNEETNSGDKHNKPRVNYNSEEDAQRSVDSNPPPQTDYNSQSIPVHQEQSREQKTYDKPESKPTPPAEEDHKSSVVNQPGPPYLQESTNNDEASQYVVEQISNQDAQPQQSHQAENIQVVVGEVPQSQSGNTPQRYNSETQNSPLNNDQVRADTDPHITTQKNVDRNHQYSTEVYQQREISQDVPVPTESVSHVQADTDTANNIQHPDTSKNEIILSSVLTPPRSVFVKAESKRKLDTPNANVFTSTETTPARIEQPLPHQALETSSDSEDKPIPLVAANNNSERESESSVSVREKPKAIVQLSIGSVPGDGSPRYNANFYQTTAQAALQPTTETTPTNVIDTNHNHQKQSELKKLRKPTPEKPARTPTDTFQNNEKISSPSIRNQKQVTNDRGNNRVSIPHRQPVEHFQRTVQPEFTTSRSPRQNAISSVNQQPETTSPYYPPNAYLHNTAQSPQNVRVEPYKPINVSPGPAYTTSSSTAPFKTLTLQAQYGNKVIPAASVQEANNRLSAINDQTRRRQVSSRQARQIQESNVGPDGSNFSEQASHSNQVTSQLNLGAGMFSETDMNLPVLKVPTASTVRESATEQTNEIQGGQYTERPSLLHISSPVPLKYRTQKPLRAADDRGMRAVITNEDNSNNYVAFLPGKVSVKGDQIEADTTAQSSSTTVARTENSQIAADKSHLTDSIEHGRDQPPTDDVPQPTSLPAANSHVPVESTTKEQKRSENVPKPTIVYRDDLSTSGLSRGYKSRVVRRSVIQVLEDQEEEEEDGETLPQIKPLAYATSGTETRIPLEEVHHRQSTAKPFY